MNPVTVLVVLLGVELTLFIWAHSLHNFYMISYHF